MRQRPVANLDQLVELLNRGAHVYVGHSGGKDSWAQYAALRRIVPAQRLHVVHADLGEVEWDGIKTMIRSGMSVWHDLMIAQAIHADGTPKTFFSAVRARRETLDRTGRHDAPAFPSSASRYCTSDLKTGPIWKVIRNHATANNIPIVINAVGIRGAESPARASKIEKRGTLMANAKNTNQSREAYDYWPIAHWSDDEVWQIIGDEHLPVHDAYVNGNDRLSCQFCIFGSTGDLRRAAEANPDLLAKYSELERDTRTTMFNGQTLAQRISGDKA